MDNPTWSDIYTAEELAAALDLQAAKLARKHGYYEISAELSHAAECIRDLAERNEELTKAGGDLMRKILAGRESLSKLPS
jgi:nucleotide-binding universal stress UspA family protein